MVPELELRVSAGLASELRRRTTSPESVAQVAEIAVELVRGLESGGEPACLLVRAFWACPASELPADLLQRVRDAAPDMQEQTRCLLLLATRGDVASWNDVAASVAHRIVPLTPAALSRAPMVDELVRQLGLAGRLDSPPSVTFHVEVAEGSPHVADQEFVRDHRVASVLGFGAGLPTGHALAVVAFSRLRARPAALRPFELLARRAKCALLASAEIQGLMGRDASNAARILALEELSHAQEAHAAEADLESREATRQAREQAAREIERRRMELVAKNERLRRTQRAVLNVIDDLREAKGTLEERVAERTREREELLAKERVLRLEAEAARAQAESANRMKDQFLSTVSHELRTPLSAMLGWATMLRSGRLDEQKRAAALDTIERNARAQVRLIEDLLDLGRILAGKFQLAVAPVEVVRVVAAAIESLRPAAEAKGLRLQTTLDSHATIVGDGERLQQIVWNLVSNAIKFTPRGGRVHITVLRAPSAVEIGVSDNGLGMEADLLPHVFEPFRQAEAAIHKRTGGLGLGLSIVRSLVELHGGSVKAESEGAGKGSVFTVRIPIAPVRATPTEPAEGTLGPPATATFEKAPGLAAARVLVVDDEKDTRQMVAFVLEQSDAHVTTAASASEAVALLEQETFDVLVSDVGMPGEDGLSMIARIRRLPPARGGRIPAAALTAYARSEDRAQAIRAGFDTHLAKPVEPTELALVVAALLRNREPA